jgi:hypothetical protein
LPCNKAAIAHCRIGQLSPWKACYVDSSVNATCCLPYCAERNSQNYSDISAKLDNNGEQGRTPAGLGAASSTKQAKINQLRPQTSIKRPNCLFSNRFYTVAARSRSTSCSCHMNGFWGACANGMDEGRPQHLLPATALAAALWHFQLIGQDQFFLASQNQASTELPASSGQLIGIACKLCLMILC